MLQLLRPIKFESPSLPRVLQKEIDAHIADCDPHPEEMQGSGRDSEKDERLRRSDGRARGRETKIAYFVVSLPFSDVFCDPCDWPRENVHCDPLHYLALLERKPSSLDFARPLQDWQLPECFDISRRRLEAEPGHARRGGSYQSHPLFSSLQQS